MTKAVNTRTGLEIGAKGPVDKALELLDALVQPDGPHRLADLAAHTGLPKPTVHRLLGTLAANGFATALAGGRYRAGPRLLGLAATALADSPELRLARPVLADLRLRTGQLAHYSVRDGDTAVHLAQSEPADTYRIPLRAGGVVPLHSSAVGLAMLSALPPEEVTAALDSTPLPAVTPHTITDPEAVRAALDDVRIQGFAVDDEYTEPDVRAVAAPVLGADGLPVGAIGIIGPTFTLDDAGVALYGPMVRAAAGLISPSNGGSSPIGLVQ
ncbi:IclR family transcriptional regulator [Streptomyces triticagri]|uniref:IclR family transcriptional regulator n=1 Tax=Streptomyces triticagri TaxID=2293568 RepID=A0A372MAU8_9ACTN|nr:IclR family transcriptional regulator [Streptomyces triticagri]RFU87999.1 IclR family transcriptional regulator [Streptomyces triticagri]